MGPAFDRRPGIEGWLAGTPPILALTAVEAGVEVVAEAGIEAIRAKSMALTAYAVERLDADLAPLGCALGSPRDPARRGGHVAIRHPDARALVERLMARGVVTDFREPDVIRFGLSPLTTSFADVDRGVAALRELRLGGPRRVASPWHLADGGVRAPSRASSARCRAAVDRRRAHDRQRSRGQECDEAHASAARGVRRTPSERGWGWLSRRARGAPRGSARWRRPA